MSIDHPPRQLDPTRKEVKKIPEVLLEFREWSSPESKKKRAEAREKILTAESRRQYDRFDDAERLRIQDEVWAYISFARQLLLQHDVRFREILSREFIAGVVNTEPGNSIEVPENMNLVYVLALEKYSRELGS